MISLAEIKSKLKVRTHDLSPEILAYLLSIINGTIAETDQSWPLNQESELLAAAKKSGLVLLFYDKLKNLPPKFHLSATAMTQLKNIFIAGSVNQFKLAQQIKKIAKAFNKINTSCIVLKGPALAHSLYPHPALRQSGDLDLLVLPPNMPAARKILEDLGYQCPFQIWGRGGDFYHSEKYTHPNKNYYKMIDLHFTLHSFAGLHPTAKSLEDMVNKAITIKVEDWEFSTLNHIDALIFTTFHLLYGHLGPISLLWLYDIYLLANSLPASAWPTVIKRGQELNGVWAMKICLELAETWFKLKLPDIIWPQPTKQDLSVIKNALFRQENLWSKISVFLPKGKGFWATIKQLLLALFPPPVIVLQNYPADNIWLLPRSYFRRWRFLLGPNFRQLFK
jgi:hypothetical protein